ncbi:MAG: hypothetical protein Kow009_02470 [Spirochaetales bacterium]
MRNSSGRFDKRTDGPRRSRLAPRTTLVSWVVTGSLMAGILLVGWVILRSQLYALELGARNEGERFLNYLVVSLRAVREAEGWKGRAPSEEKEEQGDRTEPVRTPQPPAPDFEGDVGILEEIVRNSDRLRDRVAGVGLYTVDGNARVRFGSAPPSFAMPPMELPSREFPFRHYLFNRENHSLIILQPLVDFRKVRVQPNEPPNQFLYLELSNPRYWSRRTISYLLFFVLEGLLLLGAWVGRKLVLRNWEYRRQLREQEELVLLGSASRALAHEFKNPLSAIALQAELLQRICAEKVGEEVSVIREEVERMRRMVDRIGDLIRDPRGQPTEWRIGDMVEGLVRKRFPSVKVDLEGPVQGKRVWMDPDRFRSALENVLQNACESGSPGSEPVELHVASEGRRILIEVRDRGEGLSGKELKRLFDPFYTTKTKEFGIGLFLSRRYVEAAGGRLDMEPREGGGTIARIILPEAENASTDCG